MSFAIVRVMLTTVLGYLCSQPLPGLLGIDPLWGVAGLTASAGFAGWVEFTLLRRGMNQKIGHSEFPAAYFARLWMAAIIGAAVAWGVKLALHPQRPWIAAADSCSVRRGLSGLHGADGSGAGWSLGVVTKSAAKSILFTKIPSAARERFAATDLQR